MLHSCKTETARERTEVEVSKTRFFQRRDVALKLIGAMQGPQIVYVLRRLVHQVTDLICASGQVG